MDIELRLTRIVDQFRSADFQIAKDREGPVFVSRETDNLFLLTAILSGYKRGNVKIGINEAGNQISISGEKPVQETIMVGIRVYKKDTVKKRFKKAFRIPDGVILDKIIAKFNDNDSVLTITMPKKSQGIRGYGIEEVNDQEIRKEGSETLQIADDDTKEQRRLENAEATRTSQVKKVEELEREKPKGKDKVIQKQETIDRFELGESSFSKAIPKQIGEKDAMQIKDEAHAKEEVGAGESEGAEKPEKKSLICAPIVAGSAILISLVAFVFHMIRNNNHPKKKD